MMKRVLFLCVENRARSQIAEGLARHFIGHQYEVFSAGSQPAERVHPMATAVMAEIGIDISKQQPKNWSHFDLENMDLIVTLCASEVCPSLPPNIKKLSWDILDPVGGDHKTPEQHLKTFRKVRDQIRHLVLGLLAADQVW